jgi:hypothetical protein
MAKILLKRTLTGFSPADEASLEITRRYKVGEIYRADVVKPRSGPHHRLCLALLSMTYHNLPLKYEQRWKSFDEFRYGVAIDAGHCIELVTPSGEIFKQARSINYDSLDEEEFSAVMPRLMTVCADILGMETPDLAGEVSRYADQSYGRAVA